MLTGDALFMNHSKGGGVRDIIHLQVAQKQKSPVNGAKAKSSLNGAKAKEPC
jgi:hypothetical protein